MFKFLFGKKDKAPEIIIKETQRETVTRALGEVNEILAGMDVKPKLTFDLEIGLFEIELPEQMPDEALALPAPDASEDADAPEMENAADKDAEPDGKAES